MSKELERRYRRETGNPTKSERGDHPKRAYVKWLQSGITKSEKEKNYYIEQFSHCVGFLDGIIESTKGDYPVSYIVNMEKVRDFCQLYCGHGKGEGF